MKVYVDLVLLLNILFDFILLISVTLILKRNVSLKRIILGSLVGGLSILFLFIKINNIELFLFKIVLSILMIISTFGYKNIKYFINNFIYLYISSVVLGGFLYLIKDQFTLKSNGLLFINNDYSISIITVVFISPIVIYAYIKQIKNIRNNYNNYYKVELFYKKRKYAFTGYLDTGNKLKDQYKKRPISLVYTDKINFDYKKCILVPYTTIKGDGLLKCLLVDKVIIDNKYIINNVLIGLSKEKFMIDGIDMILNSDMLGGIK